MAASLDQETPTNSKGKEPIVIDDDDDSEIQVLPSLPPETSKLSYQEMLTTEKLKAKHDDSL
jgi:hypothetical protein